MQKVTIRVDEKGKKTIYLSRKAAADANDTTTTAIGDAVKNKTILLGYSWRAHLGPYTNAK